MTAEACKYGTEERQQELLAMMKDIDAFFKRENISYSLDGGTLLGAIRHDGFIPWDDDIDIMVDRDNHNKIISSFHKCDGYYLKRELWIYRIRKCKDEAGGATIDIFVRDNCPDNVLLRKFKVFAIKLLQGMMHTETDSKRISGVYGLCLLITYYLGRLLSDDFKFALYKKTQQIGNKKESKKLSGYDSPFRYLGCRYPADTLEHLEPHVFEDTSFPITAQYDKYLRETYGDYMTPVRENERQPSHIEL